MPLGDRTGPAGFGQRTGRGAGYCSGFSVPGYANRPGGGFGMGGGRGFGRGRGRGFGMGYYNAPMAAPPVQQAQPMSKEDELTLLKDQARNLDESAKTIRDRIERLENQGQ